MKNEMILSSGVRIEITENGVNVISTDGELVQFNNTGKLLRKEEVCKEEVCKEEVCKAESFMEYFDFMGSEEQRIAKEWAETTEGETDNQRRFIKFVKKVCARINADYYIANIEPSIDNTGKIYYKAGEKVAVGISCIEWEKKAFEFAPECESYLASEDQLVLWYAYRIAKGYWTIEYVCDDSSIAGNYWNSPKPAHTFEVSGAREVGGARDGVGNTCKIVWGGGFAMGFFGGHYRTLGDDVTIATVSYCYSLDRISNYGSGVVVLNKVCSTDHCQQTLGC